MKRCYNLFILPLLLAVILAVPIATAEAGQVDPAATKILKRMSDYLGSLEQFSVETQNTLEDLAVSGHRIDLDVSAKVLISRPNRIRSERKGDLVDQVFYYNGDTLTLYNPTHKMFATGPAPDNYQSLFMHLYEKIGFALPISDLVYEDSYSLLIQDVTLAVLVGDTYINGMKCDHLLFSRPGVDFQVWVAHGDKPLPLKYVVTDTSIPYRLSISTRLHDWNVAPVIDESQFTFIRPKGAQEITFIQF